MLTPPPATEEPSSDDDARAGRHDRLARADAVAKTVVVVDDDPDAVDAMTLLLEDRGYRVAAASNGRDALDYFRSGGRACLIVLDLMMPVMTGAEFLQARTGLPDVLRVPVIVVTASEATPDLGGSVVLRKPVDFGVLLDHIDRLAA